MYFPNKYEDHNSSLERFTDKFNEISKANNMNLVIELNEDENFIDDAIIKDELTNKQINFDWEKRVKYYENCGFPFKTFGQFERKIKKNISLSVQCCKSELCFCIAWHDDFKNETVKKIGSITESGSKEFTGKRFTEDFLEIKYDEMILFIKILRNAFDNSYFDKRSFEVSR